MAELSLTTYFWCCAAVNSGTTTMRIPVFVVALMLAVLSPAHADPLKAAVSDFELLDTSLQGEVNGPQADEQRRLKDVAEQLRKALADTGKFVVLDIAPVNAAAHASNLQACGGCDVQYAHQLGADLAITGLVQKVSPPILNMNIYLRDAPTGQLITFMSADFRGNADESWARAAS